MARKAVLAAMAVAASLGGSAATATAATSTTAAPAATCEWKIEAGPITYDGIEFWLSYNTCTRYARGAEQIVTSEGYDVDLWIYNETTGETKEKFYGYNELGTKYTDSLNDAGTLSHVCIQPYSATNGSVQPKKCTGPF